MKKEDEEGATSSVAGEATSNNGRKLKPTTHFIGRHRLQAALSHLDHQIRTFQDELDGLDSMGGPSTVCNELISGVESTPDPLLPLTRGPVDMSWERWFGGASSSSSSSSRSHRRWI